MLIGVKTDKKLKVDFVDVEIAPAESDKLDLCTYPCLRLLKLNQHTFTRRTKPLT